MRAFSSLALVFVAACSPSPAGDAPLEPQAVVAGATDKPKPAPDMEAISYTVTSPGFVNNKGKVAEDISGGACAPAQPDVVQQCVFLDDQGMFAQAATITNGVIKPGEKLPLLAGAALDKVEAVGAAPTIATDKECKAGKFEEFDGEAVAFANDAYYFAGSHGCSRNTPKIKLSSFLIARVNAIDGKPGATTELSWRLSDVLRASSVVKDQYGQKLQLSNADEAALKSAGKDVQAARNNETLNGLNVEGIAVIGDQFIVGLRAPSDDSAYLLAGSVAALFASGPDAIAPAQAVRSFREIKLGDRVGIRDLAPIGEKYLLILAGPAQEQDQRYFLQLVDPASGALLTTKVGSDKGYSSEDAAKLDTIKDLEGDVAKAEAVVLLEQTDHQARVLVMYDGLENGGPIEKIIDLP